MGGLVVCVWVCARTDTAVTVNAPDSRWHTAAQTTRAGSLSYTRKDTRPLFFLLKAMPRHSEQNRAKQDIRHRMKETINQWSLDLITDT